MALQWAIDLAQTLLSIYQHLASEGWIAFSLPLAGTFHELTTAVKNNFFSAKEIAQLLATAGFSQIDYFNEWTVTHFSQRIAALKAIKAMGANYLLDRKQVSLRSKFSLNNLNKIITASSLTYHIGYFIARKKP